jgi:hypothetical protein
MDATRLFVDHASFEEAFHRRETDLGKVPELWVPDERLLHQVLRQACPLCHSGLLNLQWFHESGLQVVDIITYESFVCDSCGYWTWTRYYDGYGNEESTIAASLIRSFEIDDKQVPAAFLSDWLRTHQEDRYRVHPRAPEAVVHSVLKEHLDCELALTKETRDGGMDLLGFDSEKGRFIVEVKRHGPTEAVGVGIVRQLAGVLVRENLCRALLISTSGFSQPARSEAAILRADTQKYPVDIELLDLVDVLSWLQVRDSRSQFANGEEY